MHPIWRELTELTTKIITRKPCKNYIRDSNLNITYCTHHTYRCVHNIINSDNDGHCECCNMLTTLTNQLCNCC